jgi:hypothetical protein
MDNSFFAYLQQLELMAFFSGYPLIYAVTLFFAGDQKAGSNSRGRMVRLLPFAYALVGTLYLGLQVRNLYPDYLIENIKLSIQHPYLTAWALLSILFWIPALGKKPEISLLHSFVFFFFLLKDLYLQLVTTGADKNIIRNDMKIYTDSLLLNLGALVLILLLSFLFTQYKKRTRS